MRKDPNNTEIHTWGVLSILSLGSRLTVKKNAK